MCSCAGRCKLTSAPSLKSALCWAGTALTQRSCNPLLAGSGGGGGGGGRSHILTPAVQLLPGHRSAQPAKFTLSSRGKTAEWQKRNRAQLPELGSIVQLINHTASSMRTSLTLRKILKIPVFYCMGCRRRTVCFILGYIIL